MYLQNIIFEFLKFILRSIVFSVLVFLISFSLLTQQFPPDFSKLKNIYGSYSKLKAISSNKSTRTKTENNKSNLSEEDNIEALMAQKQNLSQILSEMNIFEFTKSEAQDLKELSCINEKALINQLKDTIKDLDNQNLKLNKKILQIKYQRQ